LSWTEDYDFALGTGMYPNIESISTKLWNTEGMYISLQYGSPLSPIHSEKALRDVDLTVQQFGPHA
jgi:hypothetical protein